MNVVALGTRTPDRDRVLLQLAWWSVYATVLAGALVIAAVARRQVFTPYLGVSLGIVALLLVGWLLGPRPTLYVSLALTAVSDQITVAWFPFVKNLSSRESIAFVADALTVSPLDATIAVGVIVSIVRQYARHRRPIAPSRLTGVTAAFALCVAYGFANGVLRGAPLRIAVIESRPVWYIAALFAICTNELQTSAHVRRAVWALVVGVTVQSILSALYYWRLPSSSRQSLEGLNEHGSALGHNVVLLTLILILTLGVAMRGRAFALTVAAAPTLFVYAVSQRRAGFGSLIVALMLVAIVLFWKRRRTFWLIVPAGAALLAAYTLAFWNSGSSIAFAAQAVKSIVAPEQTSAADQSSDLYRMIEAYDLWVTIRSSPLRGLGFGHAFYRPVQLPEITDFELGAYISHNSFLWVWVKLGFVGFAAMFAMLGRALMVAAERIRSARRDSDLLVVTLAAGFVAMYATYTWYDISWDARNTVFLGLMLAICGRPVVEQPTTPGTIGK